MRETDESNEQQKKKYEKPRVTQYPLRPEEAVLGFCKTSGGTGPGPSNCMDVGPCQSLGS